MNDRYYTFTKIKGQQIENLLVQVQQWVSEQTIEKIIRSIDAIEADIRDIKIDGGEY
jgi:hypothetical protein